MKETLGGLIAVVVLVVGVVGGTILALLGALIVGGMIGAILKFLFT